MPRGHLGCPSGSRAISGRTDRVIDRPRSEVRLPIPPVAPSGPRMFVARLLRRSAESAVPRWPGPVCGREGIAGGHRARLRLGVSRREREPAARGVCRLTGRAAPAVLLGARQSGEAPKSGEGPEHLALGRDPRGLTTANAWTRRNHSARSLAGADGARMERGSPASRAVRMPVVSRPRPADGRDRSHLR